MCTPPEHKFAQSMRLGTTKQHFLKQNQYKHMMSACSSDLNVSGENTVARGSCSESEPVGKEDFSPAGSKTDGAETLNREVSVLLGRCAAYAGSHVTDVS